MTGRSCGHGSPKTGTESLLKQKISDYQRPLSAFLLPQLSLGLEKFKSKGAKTFNRKEKRLRPNSWEHLEVSLEWAVCVGGPKKTPFSTQGNRMPLLILRLMIRAVTRLRSRADPVRRMLSSLEMLGALAPELRKGICDKNSAWVWF